MDGGVAVDEEETDAGTFSSTASPVSGSSFNFPWLKDFDRLRDAFTSLRVSQR